MREILVGKDQKGGRDAQAPRVEAQLAQDNDGVEILEVLDFAESLASEFRREVTEWSILYAKPIIEPRGGSGNP